MSKLKATEQMHQVASDERQEEMQMRSALEQQISQVRIFVFDRKALEQSYKFVVGWDFANLETWN